MVGKCDKIKSAGWCSVLEYSDDLQKGGFKVTNPNAVAHCSCGESFSA